MARKISEHCGYLVSLFTLVLRTKMEKTPAVEPLLGSSAHNARAPGSVSKRSAAHFAQVQCGSHSSSLGKGWCVLWP